MTEQRPLDATRVARDDALLDALARGAALPADDELAGLLTAWRADLDDPPAEAVTGPRLTALRRRRRARTLIVIAAAVAGVGGGATAAAAYAGPESPLWPVTRVLFPHRAESQVAEQAAEERIERARTAIDEQRYADAARLLDEATEQTEQVADPRVVDRLREEIATVRGLLAGLLGAAGAGADGGAGPPTGASPAPSGTTVGTGGVPVPGASPTPASTPGGILPSLPLPLPSLPLPLPSLPPIR